MNFFQSMMSHHLLPCITIPTKINHKVNTVIDNIFTNKIYNESIAGNLTFSLSDNHLPSFLIVPKESQIHKSKNNNYLKRDTKNFNKNHFAQDLMNIDWNNVIGLEMGDVHHSNNKFLSKINEVLDKHMPFRKITQKEFKQQQKPWINNDIIGKIRYKNILYKRLCKEKNENKKNFLLQECKQIRNELTNATRTSKKAYYDNYFSKNTNCLKKIWKGIKEIINIKAKNISSPMCVQNDKGKMVDSPQDIADTFNKYYSNIAGNILSKRKYSGSTKFSDYLTNPTSNSFSLHECDPAEVEAVILLFNTDKKTINNNFFFFY